MRPCFRIDNNKNVFPIETVVQTNDWFSMLSSLDVYLGTGVTLLEHTYCFYKTYPLQKFKIVVNITKEKSVLFLAHTVVQNSRICHLQNCFYYCSFASIPSVWQDACIFKSCALFSHTLNTFSLASNYF